METIRRNSVIAIRKVEDEDIKALKQFIEDFLKKNDAVPQVRQYLEKVRGDEELLMCYLRGRKVKAEIAWDTLLRYTQNKFQFYPEIFPDALPERLRPLLENHVIGTLKHLDKLGRRITFVDISKWDANVYSCDELTMAAIIGAERFWKRPEVQANGVIHIANTQGFGLAHARQHKLSHVMRARDVFMHSFPVAIKGFYHTNMPYLFTMICRMFKHLFTKKMRSRMFFYSPNDTPTELFEVADIEILPTFVGGKLPIEEAAEDISFYDALTNN